MSTITFSQFMHEIRALSNRPTHVNLLDLKTKALTRFFNDEKLDAAVVGLSGGIDSAVVAGLLHRVRLDPYCCLKRVVGLSVPITTTGTTGQYTAKSNAHIVAEALGIEIWDVDGTTPALNISANLFVGCTVANYGNSSSNPILSGWTNGQIASIVRTPIFYGAAAYLQQLGHRSIVVGTTNRDEGAYLGFFGKASDAMVDLQPIADLHKSEVYGLARLLGIPDVIFATPPRGDVFDGRNDQEMIGATYDEIEAHAVLTKYPHMAFGLISRLDEFNRERILQAFKNIEMLHEKNAHKYAVGSPAHFIDVVERGVKNGWR